MNMKTNMNGNENSRVTNISAFVLSSWKHEADIN
jgi:hypothetical protein